MLTASIVTYHTDSDELRGCVDSLAGGDVARVYVVDNGREERIRRVVEEYPFCEYIPHSNAGYGAGHNAAIRRAMDAGSESHLVLNSDVSFNPELPGKLLKIMEERPDVGLLHPRLVYPDGSLQPTVRMLPTPWDVFGRRFLPRRLFSSRNDRYTLKGIDLGRAHDVPYVQGSFMFLRMDALRDVGLFDERFFMYPEDIDLTRRLHSRWRTLYWPQLTAVHAHRAASYSNLRMLRIHISNMIRYFNKWGWLCDRQRRETNRRLLDSLRNTESFEN